MEQKENALLVAVKEGVLNAQNIEEAQRYLQINLAANLIGGVHLLSGMVNQISDLHKKLVEKLIDKYEVDLESMESEELLEALEVTQKMIINSVEVQRKVAQGKALLAEYPALSEEEKEVVKLLKNLETPADKKLFLDTLKGVLQKKTQAQDDFEEEISK